MQRAIEFIQCIASDFEIKLKKILQSTDLMRVDFDTEYANFNKQIQLVQETWTQSVKDFRSRVGNRANLNYAGNRFDVREKFDKIENVPLFKRIKNVTVFRSEHSKLESVIDATFQQEERQKQQKFGQKNQKSTKSGFREQALKDLRGAYDHFCQAIDVLDVGKEGQDRWEEAKKSYDGSTKKIEDELTKLLKQKLEQATNANEMFQVFTVYNKLFMRPKIRGAITQYQSTLLSSVDQDIQQLRNAVLKDSSLDITLNKLRDMPDVSNKIIYFQ
jgi:dynein heavy chain 1